MESYSDCKPENCSHYWCCGIKEAYKEYVEKRQRSIERSADTPEFIEQTVSYLCKYQDFNQANSKKYKMVNECDDCKHNEICKLKEGTKEVFAEMEEKRLHIRADCVEFEAKQ